jgi:hypothetical protein
MNGWSGPLRTPLPRMRFNSGGVEHGDDNRRNVVLALRAATRPGVVVEWCVVRCLAVRVAAP